MTTMFRSLGKSTDMIFARASGEVVDRGEYVVVYTPSNPDYYFCNYLIFRRAPRVGDLPEWSRRFRQEMPHIDRLNHTLFAWDGADAGDIDAFVKAGYCLERGVVLATDAVCKPAHHDPQLEVRPVTRDRQWGEVVELSVRNREPCHEERAYRRFAERQAQSYRAMIAQGTGCWYGAYVAGELAGSLGVFWLDHLARYQSVVTDAPHRRRGVCSTLVYETAMATLAREVTTLVMEADLEYHAARLYERVGFKRAELNHSLLRVQSRSED